MPRTVELAWLAERVELLGRPFDAAAFFPHQVHLSPGQARRHGIEDVVGQVLGLGQEHHGRVEPTLGYVHAKVAALREASVQRGLIPSVPAPAMGIGQTAEQVIGGQAGQQDRTLE
ncbi:hypothetical protein D3C78_1670000 [compost metagenome]